MSSRLRTVFVLILFIIGIFTQLCAQVVNAADPINSTTQSNANCSDLNFLTAEQAFEAANDILYFDACANCTATSATSNATSANGAVIPATGQGANGLTAQQQAFVDKFHDTAQQLSIQYGIPWEAVMAQGIEESSAGTADFAVNRNNYFGINAQDANPGLASSFATPQAGWQGYYDFIANNPTYRNHGVFQGQAITDPQTYLQDIKNAGYATDSNYVNKNMALVNNIDAYAQSKGWASSAQLAQQNPQMLTNAAQHASQNGSSVANSTPSGTSGGTGSSTSCSSSTSNNAAPTGNIASTAQNLSNPSAKGQPCYIMGGGHGDLASLQQDIANGFTGNYGVDCSGFVRAVIYQATGKDPGAMDTNAMCANTAVYQHIPRAQAQPGDLAIDCQNHVEVITNVNGDGTYNTIGSHDTGCGPKLGPSPGNFQGTGDYVLRYTGSS